jgi:hypothetical protein
MQNLLDEALERVAELEELLHNITCTSVGRAEIFVKGVRINDESEFEKALEDASKDAY